MKKTFPSWKKQKKKIAVALNKFEYFINYPKNGRNKNVTEQLEKCVETINGLKLKATNEIQLKKMIQNNLSVKV